MKRAVVCGASGLIGSHLVRRLKVEGYHVLGLARTKLANSPADEFWTCDLREEHRGFFENADEIYQLASNVGGLGYISDHANDIEMLRGSTQIDMAILNVLNLKKKPKVFFASSACVYNIPGKRFYAEKDAYPANCSNEFAWQKLFAERLYQSYARIYELDIRIGRLFNTYGEGMQWTGGREKSVAALCRKIAESKDGDVIEVWGNGEQTRAYTHVDDCVEGIRRLMESNVPEPLNIGPAHEVTIRDLIRTISRQAGKQVFSRFGDGPTGVSKICSDNTLIKAKLGWEPAVDIEKGLQTVYPWIEKQVLDATQQT